MPEGYTESEVVLNLVNSDDGNITVTSPNSNVEVIKPEDSNVFEIKITLQKEQQGEPTPQSEDTTESSDDNTQGTEEITEPSDDEMHPTEEVIESSDNEKTGSADEQPTTSEEIKNNDNAEEGSSSEKSVKKSAEAVSKNSSGNGTKVSVITPKVNDTKAENSVIAPVKKAPETGDKNNTPLWITIAGASAGVLTTAVIARKRKRS